MLLRALSNIWLHVIFGMLILCAGLVAEYHYSCDYFQRFGSVLVIYTLCLVFIRNYVADELNKFYYLQREYKQISLDKTTANAHTIGSENSIKLAELLKVAKELALEKIDDQIVRHKGSVKFITATEIMLGITGTAVWGFGDILVFKFDLIPLSECLI